MGYGLDEQVNAFLEDNDDAFQFKLINQLNGRLLLTSREQQQ